MDPKAKDPKISSVIISKDATELQSLYIVYQKDPSDATSFIKVFRQESLGKFSEMTESLINNLEIHSQI